jgi:hypothetical protein
VAQAGTRPTTEFAGALARIEKDDFPDGRVGWSFDGAPVATSERIKSLPAMPAYGTLDRRLLIDRQK